MKKEHKIENKKFWIWNHRNRKKEKERIQKVQKHKKFRNWKRMKTLKRADWPKAWNWKITPHKNLICVVRNRMIVPIDSLRAMRMVVSAEIHFLEQRLGHFDSLLDRFFGRLRICRARITGLAERIAVCVANDFVQMVTSSSASQMSVVSRRRDADWTGATSVNMA